MGSKPLLCALTALVLFGQEGPIQPGSNTVSKPRKKEVPSNEPESDLPKIPSKLSPKTKEGGALGEGANFKVDTNIVSVDVAVLDDKGHFIPGIPKGNFRILEDNVPQQVSNFALGEAPETVCLVVEFSNLFQSYYGSGWFQTLQAVYGFV